MAGEATAGSSRVFRLDPHTLPVRGSARDGGTAHTAFILDRDRAIVQRQRHAGPPFTLTVPLADYRGVAVRMEPTGAAGQVRVFVELLHADPALTLPLIVGDEPEDVAADWQAWGRALNLPLLVIGQDGSVSAPLGLSAAWSRAGHAHAGAIRSSPDGGRASSPAARPAIRTRPNG